MLHDEARKLLVEAYEKNRVMQDKLPNVLELTQIRYIRL